MSRWRDIPEGVAADRLASEKGKGNRAQCCIGYAERASASFRRNKSQGVVFQRLVGDPLIVSTSFQNDALWLRHRWASHSQTKSMQQTLVAIAANRLRPFFPPEEAWLPR